MKKETLVMVANSSFARLYKAINNHALAELETWDHPKSRLHDQDLVTSRPGRSFDSVGPGRHAMQTQISPKTQEFHNFAKDLALQLEKAVLKGDVKKIYIAAPPTFLGILRQRLSNSVASLVAGEIPKDFTTMSSEQIRDYLPPVI